MSIDLTNRVSRLENLVTALQGQVAALSQQVASAAGSDEDFSSSSPLTTTPVLVASVDVDVPASGLVRLRTGGSLLNGAGTTRTLFLVIKDGTNPIVGTDVDVAPNLRSAFYLENSPAPLTPGPHTFNLFMSADANSALSVEQGHLFGVAK